MVLECVGVWPACGPDRETLIMPARTELYDLLALVPSISLDELDERAALLRRIRKRDLRAGGTQLMRYDALGEHARHNILGDPPEIERFYDRCSDLMRELLDALAAAPDRPRSFPEIEDSIGWPRRRIASVLGGVSRLRNLEFAGRRPYHFHDPRQAASRRWEMWMDAGQADAVRAARMQQWT